MAVSSNNKYLAVCERSQQAICLIYELGTLKRRRILTSSESAATEFIDVKFTAQTEDKLTNFLFTLVSKIMTVSFAKVKHAGNLFISESVDKSNS